MAGTPIAVGVGRSGGTGRGCCWRPPHTSPWAHSTSPLISALRTKCTELEHDIIASFKVTHSTIAEAPTDPNFISGPSGYGTPGFVPDGGAFPYTINFENKPSAPAPAQVVEVTQQLDPDLDWSTFQLGDFGFGGQLYAVPAGLKSYQTRIDARSTTGVYVDVERRVR